MSSGGLFDLLKWTYQIVQFKYEQWRLTTTDGAIVQTSKGSVKGIKRITIWGDEYYSFEGIPFAKPPLGELRFRAPQPAEPWNGVRDCTSAAEGPLQSTWLFKYKGSEDCLYLNVFTRNFAPEKPCPVMVWIHGGGFQKLQASRDLYSPDYFMTKDVVLVTISYRLGPFGFLSFKDQNLDVPGNAGIKDQLLALQWIQENISEFGGDPKNITLFGQSAGGSSAHLCMLSQRSKGLIHKAILMSGSALCPWSQCSRDPYALRLAQNLGFNGENKESEILKFLSNCAGPDILKATQTVLNETDKHNLIPFAFGPVIEPYESEHCVISKDVHKAMQKTWSNDIPIMIGGTGFEGLLFYPTTRKSELNKFGNCKKLLPLDLELSEDSIEREKYGLKLKKTYFADEECSEKTFMEFLKLESDREFWHPMYRTILARLNYSQAPTYVYYFDYDSEKGNTTRNTKCGSETRGVCHGDEVCYLFYSSSGFRAPRDSPEYRMTQNMVDIWTSFAAKSDPNCDILKDIVFEPVQKGSEVKCLHITKEFEFKELPELEKMKLWNGFYLNNTL